MNEKYLTVSALTKYIKHRLEQDQHLQKILIKGEISNFVKTNRGHLYFTLKDDSSQIRANMFLSYANTLSFLPKDGDHVLIEAKINLYEPRGEYSLNVIAMTLEGVGELYLKYEQLKKALEEQGYFKDEHKLPIPKFPRAIGVITSPTGAVIQDILNTVNRRYRLTKIILYPSLVQGETAKHDISNQIKKANKDKLVDVLIVGRGGGSIEDLWAFNEIEVIQAIFDSKIPIISAIGHETDYTISDFVSSLRAPTPTAAAELATPNSADLAATINDSLINMKQLINQKFDRYEMILAQLEKRLDLQSPISKLETNQEKLNHLTSKLTKEFIYKLKEKENQLKLLQSRIISPNKIIENYFIRFDYLANRLNNHIKNIYERKQYLYQINLSKLNSNNPLKTLEKGFGLVSKDKEIITSRSQVESDDILEIEIIDGKIITKVLETREK